MDTKEIEMKLMSELSMYRALLETLGKEKDVLLREKIEELSLLSRKKQRLMKRINEIEKFFALKQEKVSTNPAYRANPEIRTLIHDIHSCIAESIAIQKGNEESLMQQIARAKESLIELHKSKMVKKTYTLTTKEKSVFIDSNS
jgi:flagellar biosynthesis/type III secretory pathway chaperone